MKAIAPLLAHVRACRFCVEHPISKPLPHPPRPVLQASRTARLLIASQAPGTRVHASGRPFTDPSGDRLREWLGIGPDIFYDASRVAIVPMGLCFPGHDRNGGDLPPRRECAPRWRSEILAALPNIELTLAVGRYAQAWHLPDLAKASLTETVRHWREALERHRLLPLPHPSWRNNAWLKRNPCFAEELLPVLRREVARLVGGPVEQTTRAHRRASEGWHPIERRHLMT